MVTLHGERIEITSEPGSVPTIGPQWAVMPAPPHVTLPRIVLPPGPLPD